jgi:hypothetical protein
LTLFNKIHTRAFGSSKLIIDGSENYLFVDFQFDIDISKMITTLHGQVRDYIMKKESKKNV